jgi:hypothetical protein
MFFEIVLRDVGLQHASGNSRSLPLLWLGSKSIIHRIYFTQHSCQVNLLTRQCACYEQINYIFVIPRICGFVLSQVIYLLFHVTMPPCWSKQEWDSRVSVPALVHISCVVNCDGPVWEPQSLWTCLICPAPALLYIFHTHTTMKCFSACSSAISETVLTWKSWKACFFSWEEIYSFMMPAPARTESWSNAGTSFSK